MIHKQIQNMQRTIHAITSTFGGRLGGTFLVVLLLCVVSCKEDDAVVLPPMQPDFIQSVGITFEGVASGQEQTVRFVAPADWTAEVHSGGDWLRAENTHGKAGNAEITLSPKTDNYGVTSRTATLEIYADGYDCYTIKVEQRSAATGDLVVSGHVDNSTMTLRSDVSGTVFTDTIYVTSTKAWELQTEQAVPSILSFQTDGTPRNGESKTIMVVVSADYAKFQTTNLSSSFSIKASDGSAVPIRVNARATASVYGSERPAQDEQEKLSFELKDDDRNGSYTADMYVDSNVRWWVTTKPDWVETSADWSTGETLPTNVGSTGAITAGRQHITLRVKASHMNTDGHTGILSFTDALGRTLKTINLVFAGVSKDFISNTLSLPASDIEGNPWAFEAKETTVETGDAVNRKRISMDFMMTTSTDYRSIDEAPFHMLMVDATNGIAHHKEVHWASLAMGDEALSSKTESGMYTKQLYLEANERGDKDDKQGLTQPENARHAFVFIVPANISFDDLWEDEYTLRAEYADNLVLISQKNDPDADYRFALEGLANEEIIDVNPAGETKTFAIQDGSYMQIDYVIELKNSDGSWSPTSACSLEINDNVTPARLSFVFTENKAVTNPFTHVTTGSPRDIRIRFMAFIGDGVEAKTIYTIYAHQELK